MKRIGIILMLTLMITLSFAFSSCKKDNQNTDDITSKYASAKKYTAVLKITNSDSQYKAVITKNENAIKAEINEPELLKGFWVEFANSQYKIGYLNISTDFTQLPTPADSAMKNIFEGINLLEGRAKELSLNNKDENTVLSGKLENGISARVIFDKTTNLPIKIEFDSGEGLSIEFESFTVIN